MVTAVAMVPMPIRGIRGNAMKRELAIAACVASLSVGASADHFVVILNGQNTVDVTDKRLLDAGFIGLQYGSGVVKFRKVQIRSL
jgi:hypothetical protein